jgi:hypothetical protein
MVNKEVWGIYPTGKTRWSPVHTAHGWTIRRENAEYIDMDSGELVWIDTYKTSCVPSEADEAPQG